MNKILNPISIMCHVLRLLSSSVIIAHKINLTIMEAIEFEGDTHYGAPATHNQIFLVFSVPYVMIYDFSYVPDEDKNA